MPFPNCVDMKYSKPFIYIIYTWHMSYLKYCSLQMTVAKKLKIGRASPKKQMSPIEIRLRIRTLCFRFILYLHSHLYLNITFRIGLCSSFLTFVFTTLRTFYMTAGSKGSLTHGYWLGHTLPCQIAKRVSNSSLCKSASKIQLLQSVLRFTLCVVGDNTVANVFSLFDS